MKWILVVVAIASALVIGADAVASRDQNCPEAVRSASPQDSTPAATALAALGPHLSGADEITRDHTISKGFETVTFRGYDADGDLMGRVVVEKVVGGWGEARVDMCER